MSIDQTIENLKAEHRALLDRVNQYGSQLLALEKQVLLLERTPPQARVKDRMMEFVGRWQGGCGVKLIAKELGLATNTVQVTLRRNPQLFERVGWGVYKVREGL